MKHDNQDRRLRKKFESYTPSVDETDMWEDIEAALPPHKSNRRYLLFFFLLIGIGSIGVATHYLSKINSSDLVSTANAKKDLASTKLNSEDKSNNSKSLNINTQDKPTSILPIKNEKQNYIALEKTNQAKLASQYIQRKTSATIMDKTDFNEPKSITTELNTAPILIEEKPVIVIKQMNLLQNRIELVHFEEEPLNWQELLPALKGAKLKTVKESKWTFGTMVNIGKSISDYQGAPVFRETGLEAFSTQFDIQYSFTKKWSVGIGASYLYTVSNSRVNTLTETTTIGQDTLAITHSNAGTEVLVGSREFTTSTRASHIRHQRSQQIFLPISLRYTKSISNRWNLQLGLGYGFGIWSDLKGIIQDEQGLAYNLDADIENRLRLRGAERLIAETYLTGRIGKLAYFKFGAQYLHDISGRYNNQTNRQKRSHAVQLSGGISIPLRF